MKSETNTGLAQQPPDHLGNPPEARVPVQTSSEEFSDNLSRNNGSDDLFHFLIKTEDAFEDGFIRSYN